MSTKSPYRDELWYRTATVRSKPRRVAEPNEEPGRLYFSPNLIPAYGHDLVQSLERSARDAILLQSLYLYLDFTAKLELQLVNVTVQRIAEGGLGVALPDSMLIGAHQIYCDEGYHALFSADLIRQVETATGVNRIGRRVPAVIQRFRDLQNDLPEDLLPVSEALFATVSETLISGTLSQIPGDPRVRSTIRHVVADHRQDEAVHSLYFTRFLESFWPTLPPGAIRILGPLLPKFIHGFLTPDFEAMRETLRTYGLSRPETDAIMIDSYPPAELQVRTRRAAAATVKAFEAVGALEHREIRDAMGLHDLLDVTGS